MFTHHRAHLQNVLVKNHINLLKNKNGPLGGVRYEVGNNNPKEYLTT